MRVNLKNFAILLTSAALLSTVGCASKPYGASNEPIGVVGNSAYATPPLINNSEQVRAASRNLQGVVNFAFDSSEIDARAASILDSQLAFLKQNPDAVVLIAGHTDERGSNEYNHALGQRRAQAVRNYLATRGVINNRIQTTSHGEDRPIAMGHTEADYAQNRRAELIYE